MVFLERRGRQSAGYSISSRLLFEWKWLLIYLRHRNVRQITKIPLAHFLKIPCHRSLHLGSYLSPGEEVNRSAFVTVQEPHIRCRHTRKSGKGRSEEWIILLMRTLRGVEEAKARSMAVGGVWRGGRAYYQILHWIH